MCILTPSLLSKFIHVTPTIIGKWFSEGVNRKSSMQTIQPKMHIFLYYKEKRLTLSTIESSVTKQLCPLDTFLEILYKAYVTLMQDHSSVYLSYVTCISRVQ